MRYFFVTIILILLHFHSYGLDREFGSISSDNITVYQTPSLASSIVGKLYRGEPFGVYDEVDSKEQGTNVRWILINSSDISGWIIDSNDFDDIDNSAPSLFEKANKLENINVDKAIKIYKMIINRYPKARWYNQCGEPTTLSIECKKRLEIIYSKNKQLFSVSTIPEARKYLINSLKSNNAKTKLNRIFYYKIFYYNDKCIDQMPISYKDIISLIDLSDFDYSDIRFKENILIIARIKLPGSYHAFYFKKKENGWKITRYETEYLLTSDNEASFHKFL
jgi:hypothetical protein